jgi:hypothetical protein
MNLNNGKILRAADWKNGIKTIQDIMGDSMTTQEGLPQISNDRFARAVVQINLLRSMEEIDNAEVKRLISLLKSPDRENWYVAEECIKQKLS